MCIFPGQISIQTDHQILVVNLDDRSLWQGQLRAGRNNYNFTSLENLGLCENSSWLDI